MGELPFPAATAAAAAAAAAAPAPAPDPAAATTAADADAADAAAAEGSTPHSLAAVTSVGLSIAASCRMNHLAVSSGVDSSPAMSHEKGNKKVCVPPARGLHSSTFQLNLNRL